MVQLANILRQIENDQYFVDTKFTVSLYDVRQGRSNYQSQKRIEQAALTQWCEVMRNQWLTPHYANFDLNQLKTIVLGSVGVSGYNSCLALTAEDGIFRGDLHNVPPEVHRFIDILHEALGFTYDRQYDFFSRHAKQSTLFLNVCLSTDEFDWMSAVCCTRFINNILQMASRFGKRLAIIDLRQSKHIHADNLMIAPEYVADNYRGNIAACDADCQTDELFRLKHTGHLVARLGKREPTEMDKCYMYTALLEMHNQAGYHLDRLYMPHQRAPLAHNLTQSTSFVQLEDDSEDGEDQVDKHSFAPSNSCTNSLSSSFVEVTFNEVPKANKPSFVSKNDTLDSEQVLIEKVMQLSMKLPDEVQNFIDKLKPISEDCSDFLLYLFKHQHINYDESDKIMSQIDDYLQSPYGIDLKRLDWVQYVIGFYSMEFTSKRSTKTNIGPKSSFTRQNSTESAHILLNYDLTKQNYLSFIQNKLIDDDELPKVEPKIEPADTTSLEMKTCSNIIRKFITNATEPKAKPLPPSEQILSNIAMDRIKKENISNSVQLEIDRFEFKTDTNPFRIDNNFASTNQSIQPITSLNIKDQYDDLMDGNQPKMPLVASLPQQSFHQKNVLNVQNCYQQASQIEKSPSPSLAEQEHEGIHCIYMPAKQYSKVDEHSLITQKCKPQFDRFLQSRLRKNKRDRNIQSLRLLLTLTAKHKWFLRYLTIGNRDELIHLLTSKEQFGKSAIDDQLYLCVRSEDNKIYILFSSECEEEALIFGNNNSMQILLGKLSMHIESYSKTIDKMGKCKFLGIEFYFDAMQKCFFLSQSEFIKSIISRHNIAIPSNISAKKPISNSKLEALEYESSQTDKPVTELINDLLDISSKTRPDICASVSILSNYKHKKSVKLWQIALDIVYYLHETKSTQLRLKPLGSLNCFTDGSGINNIDTNESNRNTLMRNNSKGGKDKDLIKITQQVQQTLSVVKQEMDLSGSSDMLKLLCVNTQTSFVADSENRERTEDSVEAFDCSQQGPTDAVDAVDSDDCNSDDGSVIILNEQEIVETDSPDDDFRLAHFEMNQKSSISITQMHRSSLSNPYNELSAPTAQDYTNKSQTGYLLRSYQCPIPWASEHVQIEGIKDTDTVFIELIGAARCSVESHVMKMRLEELGFGSSSNITTSAERTEIFVDNQIVIEKIEKIHSQLTTEQCSQVPTLEKKDKSTGQRIKLPQLDKYLHTLLYLKLTEIELTYVQSRSNTADLFTKVITNASYDKVRQLLNLVDQ